MVKTDKAAPNKIRFFILFLFCASQWDAGL
jgi:hypothetical protein